VVPVPGRHARERGVGWSGRIGGWLHDRLPPTLQGRVGLAPAHLVLLAGVLAVGLVAAAVVVLRSSPEGEPVPPPRPASALITTAAAPDAASTAGDGDAAGPSGPNGTVVVDVAGKVRRPGVTTLPAGSRVIDAIRKAGGPRRGVNLTALNLARVLVDGEQVLVGLTPAPGVASSAAAAPSASGTTGPLVNLNTASPEQLEALPGVGPVTASKIADWRAEHGAFTSVEDLLEVDGIGEKTLAELAPHVTL
jgi:competence protein ComEA